MNPTSHYTANLFIAQVNTDSSLWTMIQQGGWAMYPLAAVSLTLLYFAIQCYLETQPKRFFDSALTDTLSTVRTLDPTKLLTQLAPHSHILSLSLQSGLQKFDTASPSDSIDAAEQEIGSVISEEERAIAQKIHYLSVIANVAPMIGLLGTVSGMIGGFQTMASGGMGRPELFAGDIGEALITTATGLCIGIPAMVAHSYFNNRLNTQIANTLRHANQATEALQAHSAQSRRIAE